MTGGGGGGGETTSRTVTQQQLSPEQQRLLGMVMPTAERTIANPPTFFPGQTVAPLRPEEIEAQQGVLQAARAGGQVDATGKAANEAFQFLSGPVLDPNNNPALQGTFDAALRPLNRAFTTSVLPNIRGQAIQSGQFGGSRQGIAEGLATQGFMDASGDVTSRIASEAYGQGLKAMTGGLALAPQTQAMSLSGPQAIGSVGAQNRFQDQALIDEAIRRHSFEQLAPFQTAQAVSQLAFGMPGGSTLTEATGPAPRGASPGMSALGGAAGGAAMGSMFGPWGTAGGAALGLLLSQMG